LTIQNTLSNLTYEILTNSILDTNLADWGVWQVLTASNSVIVAPPFPVGSNSLFFASQLVLITGTNQIADWWQMKYFGQLGVDPYADPDLDGLCNYSEYILGSNPTNAHSMSATKTDAQYFFLAYTNDSSTRLLLFQTNGPGTNAVTLTLSNTLVGSNYQIYSKDMSITNGAWRVETNFVGTNTATQITIPLNGRTLAFIGGDGEDPDGDGLPSGYEVLATHTDPLMADTFNTGTPDGYKDPDGDVYNNLQEYYNGTDPLVWDPPAAPGGFEVALNNSGSNQTATLTWNSAGGSVTGYVIYRDTGSGFVAIATNSAGSTSYTDNSLPSNRYANYQIQAVYGNGSSLLSASLSAFYNPSYNFPIAIVNGPSNRLYLVVSAMPANVTNFVITRVGNGPDSGWEASYPIEPRWAQVSYGFESIGNGSFSIPAGALTNGIALIPPEEVPPYGSYQLLVEVVGADGKTGGCEPWGMDEMMDVYHIYGAVPFMDATAQMRNNLAFLMSWGYDAFTAYSGYAQTNYGVVSYDLCAGPVTYPSNYVYASYYMASGDPNPFMPYEDNCIFSNLQYNASFGQAAHPSVLPTGVSLDVGGPEVDVYVNQAVTFPTLSYVNSGTAPSSPSGLIVSNNQWFYLSENWFGPDSPGYPPYLGVYQNGSLWSMSGGYTNNYGLRYQSFEVNNGGGTFALLSPTQSVPAGVEGFSIAYSSVTAPAFSTAGYYFVRLPQPTNYGYEIDPSTYTGPLPGSASFDPTNTTRLLITSVGNFGEPLYIAGYAKQVATNGSPNVFAYLGQYFTNALLMQNGTNTSTVAGIVSEYGSFFPTLPGQIALMTKPDPDQGNLQGQCIINVIGLSVDLNRDGILDGSFTGPDATSSGRPFAFWVNDNIDSGDDGGNGGIPGQPIGLADGSSGSWSPFGQQYYVHGTRDLVDYFPVYINISSVAQLWLTNQQYTNLEFRLSQADGALRFVYTSLTPTNFMDYLLNTNVAESLSQALTTTIPASGVDLANSFLMQIALLNQGVIIVEAWKPTTQPLVLDILQNGNVIAETSLYLSITGVEQMFRFKNLTAAAPPYVQEGLTDRLADSDVPNEPATDGNNFVFLHGYSVNSIQCRGAFSDVFKRMFWAGSHAKFYGVSWRSYTSQGALSPWAPGTVTPNYHTNVVNAFLTASNLTAFLGTLNGTNVVAAHSLGNMVVLSALSDWNAPINQYYMIDAAVAMEAIQSSAPQTTDMIYSDWIPYSTWLYSHEWNKLWPTNDGRSLLSWQNRLANFRNADVFNFYSSGEEVLRDYTGDPPASALSAIPTQIWAALNNRKGSFVWVWQEKGKGRAITDSQIGSTHGGWAFNDPTYGTNQGFDMYTHMSVTAASQLTTNQVKSSPFFDLGSTPESWGSFTADLALTNSGGSAYATANQNRILADAIPAMTLPIGANPVPRLSPPNNPVLRNFNMQALYENGWPLSRLSTSETNNWHHGDFKDMAYTYTYQFYTDLVYFGNLK
jgi:hypothetical protein